MAGRKKDRPRATPRTDRNILLKLARERPPTNRDLLRKNLRQGQRKGR